MFNIFFSLRGILILSLGFIGMIATFRRPKWGVIIFIILFYIRDGFLNEWFPFAYTTLHLPLVFGILTGISWILYKEKLPVKIPFQLWLMVVFFFVICFSRYVNGTGIFENKIPLEFLKMCILFFLIINCIQDEKSFKQVLWAIILTSLFLTLYQYYQYKTGWRSVFVVTVYNTLNRNEFANILASMIPISFSLMRDSRKIKTKIFLIFSFLCFTSGVILTYSRSAAFAMFIAIFLVILVNKNKIRNIIIFLILGILITSRISSNYYDRLSTIKDYQKDASAMGRVATNRAAINILRAHPFLGVGAGNYNSVFLNYVPKELIGWVSPGKSIHNIFLQVASETGFIGLVIFSIFIISSFLIVIKIRRDQIVQEKFPSLRNMVTNIGIACLLYTSPSPRD